MARPTMVSCMLVCRRLEASSPGLHTCAHTATHSAGRTISQCRVGSPGGGARTAADRWETLPPHWRQGPHPNAHPLVDAGAQVAKLCIELGVGLNKANPASSILCHIPLYRELTAATSVFGVGISYCMCGAERGGTTRLCPSTSSQQKLGVDCTQSRNHLPMVATISRHVGLVATTLFDVFTVVASEKTTDGTNAMITR